MEPSDAANQGAILDPSVLSRKLSRTRVCQSHTAVHHCGDRVAVPGEWADVCGFINPPNTDREWQIRGHGAFEINRDVLGIRPTTVRSEQARRQGKKRSNPYDHM